MPLGWEDFAELGRDSTLHLQPHLQLLDLQYPVDEVVLAVRRATPEIDIVSNAVCERRQASEPTLPEVSVSSVHLACIASKTRVYYRRIEREEFLHSLIFVTVIRSPLPSSVRSKAASSLRIYKLPGSRSTSRMPQSSAGSPCRSPSMRKMHCQPGPCTHFLLVPSPAGSARYNSRRRIRHPLLSRPIRLNPRGPAVTYSLAQVLMG